MEESTPKKVHPRNLICRLCCDAFESRHLTRVFGRASKKEGSKEDLASKIRNVCGINITESDSPSTLICRKPHPFFKGKALGTRLKSRQDRQFFSLNFSDVMCKPATIHIFPKNKNYMAATKWGRSFQQYFPMTVGQNFRILILEWEMCNC